MTRRLGGATDMAEDGALRSMLLTCTTLRRSRAMTSHQSRPYVPHSKDRSARLQSSRGRVHVQAPRRLPTVPDCMTALRSRGTLYTGSAYHMTAVEESMAGFGIPAGNLDPSARSTHCIASYESSRHVLGVFVAEPVVATSNAEVARSPSSVVALRSAVAYVSSQVPAGDGKVRLAEHSNTLQLMGRFTTDVLCEVTETGECPKASVVQSFFSLAGGTMFVVLCSKGSSDPALLFMSALSASIVAQQAVDASRETGRPNITEANSATGVLFRVRHPSGGSMSKLDVKANGVLCFSGKQEAFRHLSRTLHDCLVRTFASEYRGVFVESLVPHYKASGCEDLLRSAVHTTPPIAS